MLCEKCGFDNPEEAMQCTMCKEELVPFATSRHEHQVAQIAEALPVSEPEPEPEALPPPPASPSPPEEEPPEQNNLSTMLDTLIADLLEVEIHEGNRADSIETDESALPSADPAAYTKPPRAPLDLRGIARAFLLATVIFLLGIGLGLLGSYLLDL